MEWATRHRTPLLHATTFSPILRPYSVDNSRSERDRSHKTLEKLRRIQPLSPKRNKHTELTMLLEDEDHRGKLKGSFPNQRVIFPDFLPNMPNDDYRVSLPGEKKKCAGKRNRATVEQRPNAVNLQNVRKYSPDQYETLTF